MTRERVASAPGRANLLGEHVDHQGGTVLPVALQWRTTVTYTPGGAWEFSSEGHEDDDSWQRYARAVIDTLAEAGVAAEPGRVEITSTVPEARGLSSSAALEVALAGALSDLPPMELARLCQRAESERVGVPCGLMDQAVSSCAIAGNAMALDCSNETFFHVALPEDVMFLIFDLGLTRRLDQTPYAQRQAEAAQPGTDAHRHVVEEMERVTQGIERLDAGDPDGFGDLMFESHASLRDLYRCSHPALDQLVEQLYEVRGVYGARMVGGGWGGCVLAMTELGMELDGARRVLSDDGLVRME